ncbi:hypothetical protein HPB50_007506 [Hyalomma asiaticum]|uniref:Uncharacterized protein n=1 Tax=Hyalomma asiaticum TaxID=266040 RepID=A0ACB7TDG1_HYAAI|nr:hypothetical protein HPB50_007506 [Hyalomma asiaticum]
MQSVHQEHDGSTLASRACTLACNAPRQSASAKPPDVVAFQETSTTERIPGYTTYSNDEDVGPPTLLSKI